MNDSAFGPVGLIGLGRLGTAIGRRLLAGGYELVVQNRSSDVASRFAGEYGGAVASSPREVGERAAIVLTCVADSAALHDVCTGDDGLLAGLDARSLLIDTGTTGPAVAERLEPRIREIGADLLESPVSGTPDRALRGELVIMTGGSEEAHERALPVLSELGTPLHVGPVGAAIAMKLAVNLVVFGLNEATLEGLSFAEARGIDPRLFLAAVAASPAGAGLHDFLSPQYLDSSVEVGAGTYGTVSKDLALLRELAGDEFDGLVVASALDRRATEIAQDDGEDTELGAARITIGRQPPGID